MSDFMRGLTEMAPGDEWTWGGGAGTLWAKAACTLTVRPPDEPMARETEIAVGDDGGICNFNLGVGFIVSVTAAGVVSPVRDSRFVGH